MIEQEKKTLKEQQGLVERAKILTANLATLIESYDKYKNCNVVIVGIQAENLHKDLKGLAAELEGFHSWLKETEWRGVSSEVVEEFQERLQKVLGLLGCSEKQQKRETVG